MGLVLWALVWCAISDAIAQDKKNVAVELSATGITVGQMVPNLQIENLHNYFDGGGKAVSSVNLSDFKGKLVILDFWATWCAPCVGMIPVMDSLQDRFSGRVQFISVTDQSDAVVSPFLAKLNKGKKGTIPYVTADRLLASAFPHRYLPHYVWIGPDGRVAAITGHEEVNAGNIEKMLRGGAELQQKTDLFIAYDKGKPLLIDGNGGAGSNLIYHSVFTGYGQGLKSLSWLNPEIGKATFLNLDLSNMFATAYSEKIILGRHRMVFMGAETDDFRFQPKKHDPKGYEQQYERCYELVVPKEDWGRLRQLVIRDLEGHFPFAQVDTLTMETMCTVLVSTGDNSMLRAKGKERKLQNGMAGFSMECMPLIALTSRLDAFYMQGNPYPVVDGSGITFPVDMNLDCNTASVAEVNRELEKYNLKLEDKLFRTLMIVFRKKKADTFKL